MGVEDLINKIPGDPDWIRSNIKELEDRAIVIRSSDNCHGGRGHKRSIKLIDYRSIPL